MRGKEVKGAPLSGLGFTGALSDMTAVVVFVSAAVPSLTVRETVKTPGLWYAWSIDFQTPVVPSPKSQAYVKGSLSASEEAEPSKRIGCVVLVVPSYGPPGLAIGGVFVLATANWGAKTRTPNIKTIPIDRPVDCIALLYQILRILSLV